MLRLIPDGKEAFVTGIVLYRNLASILPFQRYNRLIPASFFNEIHFADTRWRHLLMITLFAFYPDSQALQK